MLAKSALEKLKSVIEERYKPLGACSKFEILDGSMKIEDLWGEFEVVVDNATVLDLLIQTTPFPLNQALYHHQTKTFEFICEPADHHDDLEFSALLRKTPVECQVDSSSKELLMHAELITKEPTLFSSAAYKLESLLRRKNPRSFFLKTPITPPYDPYLPYIMVSNLNFYIRLFDAEGFNIPQSRPSFSGEKVPRPRHLYGNGFPERFNGPILDFSLLELWQHSTRMDPASAFIGLFQILEFCAYRHIGSQAESEVRRILRSPKVSSDPIWIAQKIHSTLKRQQDDVGSSIKSLLEDFMEPGVLFRCLEPNIERFIQPWKFSNFVCLQQMPVNPSVSATVRP